MFRFHLLSEKWITNGRQRSQSMIRGRAFDRKYKRMVDNDGIWFFILVEMDSQGEIINTNSKKLVPIGKEGGRREGRSHLRRERRSLDNHEKTYPRGSALLLQ